MRKGIDKLAIIAGKHVRMLEEKIAEKEDLSELLTIALEIMPELEKELTDLSDFEAIERVMSNNQILQKKLKETEETLGKAYKKAVAALDNQRDENKKYKDFANEVRKQMNWREDVEAIDIFDWLFTTCGDVMRRKENLETEANRLRKRRNQLMKQLRDNGIEPSKTF